MLLAFLYTHCTDVCPLIAKYMDGAVRSLGPRADSQGSSRGNLQLT